MKSKKKVTKLHLNLDQHDNPILLGLVSSEPDYKLSLNLNKSLRISLKNVPPVNLFKDDKEELTFSKFSSGDKSSHVTYTLFSNRSGKDFLLAKLRNIDYILQVTDTESQSDPELIGNILRKTESVTAVFRIDDITLKDRNLKYLTQQ